LVSYKVRSGTGRDPGWIFREPDPPRNRGFWDLLGFFGIRDFPGSRPENPARPLLKISGILRDFPGFFGINFSDYMIIDDKNLVYFYFYLAILATKLNQKI
jgi:hypothetical protein